MMHEAEEREALIDQVVEFCMTHTVQGRDQKTEGAVKLRPDDHYWLTIVPRSPKAEDMLPASREHARLMLELWKQAGRRAHRHGASDEVVRGGAYRHHE